MTQTTYKLDRACSTCSKRIYDSSTTGMCKRCYLRQRNRTLEARSVSRDVGKRNWRRCFFAPGAQEKRIGSIRATWDDRIGWIPKQRQAEYRKLIKSGIGSKVAKRKIRDSLTFEEKLKLVGEGKLTTYTMPTRQDWRSL